MTIYVDRFLPPFDRDKWKGGGHLLTSDIAELHRFATHIGLKRQWFQDTSAPHYDLTAKKRDAALEAGAVVITPGEFPDDLLFRRPDGRYERYADRRARRPAADSAQDGGS